jgi:hypothetical protein
MSIAMVYYTTMRDKKSTLFNHFFEQSKLIGDMTEDQLLHFQKQLETYIYKKIENQKFQEWCVQNGLNFRNERGLKIWSTEFDKDMEFVLNILSRVDSELNFKQTFFYRMFNLDWHTFFNFYVFEFGVSFSILLFILIFIYVWRTWRNKNKK